MPLSKVLVTVEGGASIETRQDGRFVLPDVPPGEIRLSASAVGYGLVQRTLHLARGETEFVAQLRQRQLLPPELLSDGDTMRLLLPVLRGEVAMLENYHYEAAQPLHCPIVACDALADPHASRGDAEGWKLETTGGFSIQRFGGDRAYIRREKEALTALIGNHLSVMVGALARSTTSLT